MIHIALATDDNFVQHCSVAMASVMANNGEVTFYIFTEGLKGENVDALNELVKKNECKLQICKVAGDVVSQFPMPSYMSSHISIATYYRLFVERILPKDVDRVLYLDCDIVVRNNLDALWNTDLTDKAIAAVYQNNEWAIDNNSFERLGYAEEYGYFNAGVLLINLKYWRDHYITNLLFAFIKNNYAKIHSHDQDVLNAVLHQHVKPISYTWNCLPSFLDNQKRTYPTCVDYSFKIEEPIIVHFVFKPKPWQYTCKHPYKTEYFKYLDMTAYQGWRPKFIWKEYYMYIFKPLIVNALLRLDVLHLRRLLKKLILLK